MSNFADTKKITFSKIGSLLRVSSQSKLKRLSKRLEATYGPPKLSSGQPQAILESAARKLVSNNEKIDFLTLREKKASIELFWLSLHGWQAGKRFRNNWLKWAEEEWSSRTGIRRIAMSAVRNYSSDSDASVEILNWLSQREENIYGSFGNFFREKDIVTGYPAIQKIAKKLASGNTDFFNEIEDDIRVSLIVKGSGFLVSMIEEYGVIASQGKTSNSASIIMGLIKLLGETGISGARGSETMREQARKSLVEGIVAGTLSRKDPTLTADLALEIIITTAGDPRISKASWRNIKVEVREEVESWLTERTIENVFKVIGSLKIDRPDMVSDRLKFWRSYLPFIKKAFLLCSNRAVPIANQLNERFGFLDNTEPDHCGMLLQIIGPSGHRLTVMMLNKNAKALFWTDESKYTPIFFDGRYNRRAMMSNRSHEMVHHTEIWQKRFADYIESETGIRRPTGKNK